jgi:hypothetical protein
MARRTNKIQQLERKLVVEQNVQVAHKQDMNVKFWRCLVRNNDRQVKMILVLQEN